MTSPDFTEAHRLLDGDLFLCPCCGKPMSDVSFRSLGYLSLPKIPRLVVSALIAAHPRTVPINQLVDAVWWDDPTGGPDLPADTIRTTISRMNHDLREYGWEIRGRNKGSPGGYGLYPVRAHQ